MCYWCKERNCFYFFKIITKLKTALVMTLGLDRAKIMWRNIIFKCKISSCYFKQNPGAHYMTSVSMSSCFRIVQHIHTINLLYHQRSPDLCINKAAALNWTLTGWKLQLLSLHTHTFRECGSVVSDFDIRCLGVYYHHPYWRFFFSPSFSTALNNYRQTKLVFEKWQPISP